MRKQYHSRRTPEGQMIWDVNRLVTLSANLPRIKIPISEIRELDEPYWFDEGKPPTCREILSHIRLLQEADLCYPIILSSDGRLMDGMHRVLKAALDGLAYVAAVKFEQDPKADYVDVPLDELPYD